MFNPKKAYREQIANTLKRDAELSGTYTPFGEGDKQVVAYEVTKYSPIEGFTRGYLSVVYKDGTKTPVISPNEEGEPINAARYELQRDRGTQYARQDGVGYGELDLDHLGIVLNERSRV